jgi:hypothetical protein
MSLVAFAIFALLLCSHVRDPVPAELVGEWTLSDRSAGKLPSQCRNLRMEFTPDGNLITFSGELRFVTKITIKRKNDGFVVHQDILRFIVKRLITSEPELTLVGNGSQHRPVSKPMFEF